MNKVKNVHSPAGMGYSLHGTRLVHLIDCPNCKYGTLDKTKDEDDRVWWKCADCGHQFTTEELQAKGIKCS